MTKKALIAFSGGLDTSYCTLYMHKKLGYEVHTLTVNTGGFSKEESDEIEKHAYNLGTSSHQMLDVTRQFWDECLCFLLYGNVLKNNTYPLSVSAERVFQAMALAHYAQDKQIKTIVHGSTGAGNDQIRFDMILQTIAPDIEIITPIRDMKLSREEEIDYLKKNGVKMNFEKAKYSINKGIWGTSVGGAETLKSRYSLPEEAFPTVVTATEAKTIKITFEKGQPKALDGQTFDHPVDLIQQLYQIAAPYGIGRDIHVGDTIIGIKGRVGFEAAAPVLLIKAHHLLEKHTLTKWQLYWKDQLANWYGNSLHEGQFLDPLMRNIERFLEDTQAHVSGDIWVKLFPYRFEIEGIESLYDLMSDAFGTYGEMNKSWTADDVKGFTKIFGNQNTMYHQVKVKTNE